MQDWLTRVAVGVAMEAGATGLGLEVAGVHSPLRTALVLFFLVVAPPGAVAGLLRGFDRFARLIIGYTATIMILALTSIIMLLAGAWSPTGGLLAMLGMTVACLVAGLPPVRRAFSAREGAGGSGVAGAGPGSQQR